MEDNHPDTVEVIDDKAIITDLLDLRADAWLDQRVKEYLLFYHDDFQTAQNMKKQSWIKDRWQKFPGRHG